MISTYPNLAGLDLVLNESNVLDPDFYDDGNEEGDELDEAGDELEQREEALSDWQPVAGASKMQAVSDAVQHASKGITDATETQYRNLVRQCLKFLFDEGLLKPEEKLFCASPPSNAPTLIVAWIMQRCDSININGTIKPPQQVREGYQHAQKMRAAAAYMYSRTYNLGSTAWHQVGESANERWVGNPCSSATIKNYMVGLKRRKVHSGDDVTTSAKAITSDVLSRLYDYNRKPENWTLKVGTRKPEKGTKVNDDVNKDSNYEISGGLVRRLLWACSALSFLCLLRFDEVLKIKAHDIRLIKKGRDGTPPHIRVTLPFRKTHQTGAIPPFVLWPLDEDMQHICPVRAVAEWIKVTKIKHGFLFRRILSSKSSGERVSEADVPMTREQFLRFFRNNLVDISIDPRAYGTHSFRRGGCQFLHLELRWPIRKVCEWGGWSTDFGYMTIVKYLISGSDDPTMAREDYFRPGRKVRRSCPTCGRSCECGY